MNCIPSTMQIEEAGLSISYGNKRHASLLLKSASGLPFGAEILEEVG
jgi:hypothetical protein